MNANKIADALIRESRGILSLGKKPPPLKTTSVNLAITLPIPERPAPCYIEVMTIERHRSLFPDAHNT